MTLTPKAPMKRLTKYQLVEYLSRDKYRVVDSSYSKTSLETKKELYKKLYNKTLHIISVVV